jgi:hypothetical protein
MGAGFPGVRPLEESSRGVILWGLPSRPLVARGLDSALGLNLGIVGLGTAGVAASWAGTRFFAG